MAGSMSFRTSAAASPSVLAAVSQPDHAWAGLRRSAHMLGFGGHFLTKSRRYSITFRLLRGERAIWQRTNTHADADDPSSTILVGYLTYVKPAGTPPAWRVKHRGTLLSTRWRRRRRIKRRGLWPGIAANVVQPVVEIPAYRVAVAGIECQPFAGGANHLGEGAIFLLWFEFNPVRERAPQAVHAACVLADGDDVECVAHELHAEVVRVVCGKDLFGEVRCAPGRPTMPRRLSCSRVEGSHAATFNCNLGVAVGAAGRRARQAEGRKRGAGPARLRGALIKKRVIRQRAAHALGNLGDRVVAVNGAVSPPQQR